MGMTIGAQEARKAYMRQYRDRNRDRINARQREWYARNPERAREYQRRYWERKSAAGSIRLPWSAYGITPERRKELEGIAKSGEYADIVLAAAFKTDRQIAGHIILSVTKGLSYEHIEFDGKLGRCPLGRTDFYGARRLFYHYLDIALKDVRGTSPRPNNMDFRGGGALC